MNQDSSEIIVVVDLNIYSIEAVKRVAFELNNKAQISIEKSTSNQMNICLSPNAGFSGDRDELIRLFNQMIQDHQIRIDIEKEYKVIRQIIVAQAFQPCDNIKEVLDLLNQ